VSKTKLFRNTAIALAVAGPLTAAMATNGYFSHGYGMKAKGMGGAAVASTDNAFAGANNPAAAAFAGDRLDLGLDIFMPSRSAANTGSNAGNSGSSDSNVFYVPEFGYNRALSDRMGVGLTVYGNGGMNTDYPKNMLTGTAGRLGVDLTQLIVAPTIAYKVSGDHSIGISPLLIQQQFKADGLSGFAGYSSNSAALSGNGYDTSSGIGVRFGYLGKVTGSLSVGVSYAPKVTMTKFSKYAGLFAEQGAFDIPENYTLGLAFQATPDVNVALDYQKIRYSQVAAIANTSTTVGTNSLGASNGPGFGWTDVNVWKLGAEWKSSPNLTLRAGYNVGDNPISSREVTFNILAPGVITTHYTLGGTYALSKQTELTVAYMYAPEVSVTGANVLGNGNDTIKMSQQSLGIQFGWKY